MNKFFCLFQLPEKEDANFQRLLSIEKDVKLIDDVLELVCRDFENIKNVKKILKLKISLLIIKNPFRVINHEVDVNISCMIYKNVLNIVKQI